MNIVKRIPLDNGDVIIEFDGYKELISNPARKWSPSWCINEHGYYEKEPTNAILESVKPGQTVLDVGANMGYYSLMMASLVGPEGRVVAFEPVVAPTRYLTGSIALNNFEHIELHHLCLGSKNTEVVFDRSAFQIKTKEEKETRDIEVPMRRFDDFAIENNLSQIDFAKIDVEGAEFDVVLGMKRTIRRYKPYLMMEVHPQMLKEFGYSAKKLIKLLERYGYQVTPLDQNVLNLDVPNNLHIGCTAR